jgi:hypothetical protein
LGKHKKKAYWLKKRRSPPVLAVGFFNGKGVMKKKVLRTKK